MKTLEEKIAVMQAALRGEKIQFLQYNDIAAGWQDGDDDDDVDFTWNWMHLDYRIKPTPKKRLMRPEEFPATVWVWGQTFGTWQLILHINDKCFSLASYGYVNWDETTFLENLKWSPDRREYRSFFVEDSE